MKMKGLTMALMLTAVLGVNTASAYTSFASGNRLLEWCESADARCTGYIMGLSDSFDYDYEGAHLTSCVPAGASAFQLKRVVMKWMEQNPEHLHRGATLLVRNALIDGFDCKTGMRYVLD